MSGARRNLFISYSHQDKRWLDELLTQLKPYSRNGVVTAWSDKQIKAGSKWRKEIRAALENARIAVLLVTPDFLASDFIYEHELTPLLKSAESGGVQILWIPVRASSYEQYSLSEDQAVIDPRKPLAEMRSRRDRAWVRVCKAIIEAAKPNTEGAASTTRATNPRLRIVHSERPKLGALTNLHRHLARNVRRGELSDSVLGPLVLEALQEERTVQTADDYDPLWLIKAIDRGDYYFGLVKPSAGHRDWQLDFSKALAPVLVGVARSLKPSPEAEVLIKKVCDRIAGRLRLRIVWPSKPDAFNDTINAIYRASREARELESDDVLQSLQRLKILGPT